MFQETLGMCFPGNDLSRRKFSSDDTHFVCDIHIGKEDDE